MKQDVFGFFPLNSISCFIEDGISTGEEKQERWKRKRNVHLEGKLVQKMLAGLSCLRLQVSWTDAQGGRNFSVLWEKIPCFG